MILPAGGAQCCFTRAKLDYNEHEGDWSALERKFDVQLDQARPGRSAGLSAEEAAK